MPKKIKLNWISQIKFLCFDVDGTLYRNVPEVWNTIRGKVLDAIIEKTGWDARRANDELDEKFRRLGSTTKVLNELGIDGQKFFTGVFEEVDLSGVLEKDIKLKSMIDRLRKNYIVGIVSNGTKTSITKKLEAVGLSPKQFDPLVATFDIDAPKPDPKPFLFALENTGCSPEETVYIGDRVETDILGAKAVGMRTIMVWGESPEADLSLPTIYDLGNLFLKIK